jgi:hypothetical protein
LSPSDALRPYGWDADREVEFAPFAGQGLLPGRVVEFVVPRDPVKVVCTGDWAAVDPEGGNPRYVRVLLPRRTAFVRSTSSKRSEGQILAANADHAIVAVPLNGEVDLGRIERFLALAWESTAQRGSMVMRTLIGPPAQASRRRRVALYRARVRISCAGGRGPCRLRGGRAEPAGPFRRRARRAARPRSPARAGPPPRSGGAGSTRR